MEILVSIMPTNDVDQDGRLYVAKWKDGEETREERTRDAKRIAHLYSLTGVPERGTLAQ